MASKIRSLIDKGHTELVAETQREVTRAYEKPLPNARDYTCDQVPKLLRRLDDFHTDRTRLRMRLEQVTSKLNFRLQEGRDADVSKLIKAQDNLMSAIGRYETLIRHGRVQRKIKLKACGRR